MITVIFIFNNQNHVLECVSERVSSSDSRKQCIRRRLFKHSAVSWLAAMAECHCSEFLRWNLSGAHYRINHRADADSCDREQKGFAYHFVSFLFLQISFYEMNEATLHRSVQRPSRPLLDLHRFFLGICHSTFSCSILLLLFVWFCADVAFCSLSIKLERLCSSLIACAARVQWDERLHQIFGSLLLPDVGNFNRIELSQRARYWILWSCMEGNKKMCVSGNWISLGAKTEIKMIRTHKTTSACLC